MIKKENLRIRDPYILTDSKAGCYYMYGTINLVPSRCRTLPIFSVCKTYDLENFEEPKVIFDGRKNNFWADRDYWAPEVYPYNGKYYLFGSCKAEGRCRATHIFVCDTPDGEYVPVSDHPITPLDWECLDGTLWIENQIPYIVFCHGWDQVKDGEICAMQLSDDLSHAVGEPFLLFKASENNHVSELKLGTGNYVTDGPFLYREEGKIKLIWSSFGNGKYLIFVAESDSIHGKWTHGDSMFDFEGGHAMIFTSLEGKKMIALHSPNTVDFERAVFYEL